MMTCTKCHKEAKSGYFTQNGFRCTDCEHKEQWYRDAMKPAKGDRFDAEQEFINDSKEMEAIHGN
jgi:hypothetical protein